MKLINFFFIYSLIGHIIETPFNDNNISGILYGYWTPIYGIGCLTILKIYDFLNKKINNKIIKYILLFIITAIIVSIIEYIGGISIEKIFGFSFWNYSKKKYNIGKYASLETALMWGLLSIVLICIHPFIKRIEEKIPKYITYIYISVFIIDILLTFIPKVT